MCAGCSERRTVDVRRIRGRVLTCVRREYWKGGQEVATPVRTRSTHGGTSDAKTRDAEGGSVRRGRRRGGRGSYRKGRTSRRKELKELVDERASPVRRCESSMVAPVAFASSAAVLEGRASDEAGAIRARTGEGRLRGWRGPALRASSGRVCELGALFVRVPRVRLSCRTVSHEVLWVSDRRSKGSTRLRSRVGVAVSGAPFQRSRAACTDSRASALHPRYTCCEPLPGRVQAAVPTSSLYGQVPRPRVRRSRRCHAPCDCPACPRPGSRTHARNVSTRKALADGRKPPRDKRSSPLAPAPAQERRRKGTHSTRATRALESRSAR